MATISTEAELRCAKKQLKITRMALLTAIDEATARGSDEWSHPEKRRSAAEKLINDRIDQGEPFMYLEGKAVVGGQLLNHSADTLMQVANRLQDCYVSKEDGKSIFELGSATIQNSNPGGLYEQEPVESATGSKRRLQEDDDNDDEYQPDGDDADDDQKSSTSATRSTIQSSKLRDEEIALTDCAILKYLDSQCSGTSNQSLKRKDVARQVCARFDVATYNNKDKWRPRDEESVKARISELLKRENELSGGHSKQRRVNVADLLSHGSKAVPNRARQIDYPKQQPYSKGQNPNLPDYQKGKTQRQAASAVGSGSVEDVVVDLPQGGDDEVAVEYQPRQPKRKRDNSTSDQALDFEEPAGNIPRKMLRLNAPRTIDESLAKDTDTVRKRKRDDETSGQAMDSQDASATSRNKRQRLDSAPNLKRAIAQPVEREQPPAQVTSYEDRTGVMQFHTRKLTQAARELEVLMNRIWYAVQSVLHQEMKKMGLPDKATAVFHEDKVKSAVLHRLYDDIIGEGPNAERRLAIMKGMPAEFLGMAIVGAFFHQDVFGSAQVPDAAIELARLREYFGPQTEFFQRRVNHNSRNYTSLEEALRWMYGVDIPKEPEQVLGSTANDLAQTLSRAIRDQTLVHCKVAGVNCENIGEKTLYLEKRLYPLVLDGLVLKMRLLADHNNYEFRWATPGDTFDASKMTGENYQGGSVVAPCFPGVFRVGPDNEMRIARTRVWVGPTAQEMMEPFI